MAAANLDASDGNGEWRQSVDVGWLNSCRLAIPFTGPAVPIIHITRAGMAVDIDESEIYLDGRVSRVESIV